MADLVIDGRRRRSLANGVTSNPKGEKASGHTLGSPREEESPQALANNVPSRNILCTPTLTGRGEATSPPAGDTRTFESATEVQRKEGDPDSGAEGTTAPPESRQRSEGCGTTGTAKQRTEGTASTRPPDGTDKKPAVDADMLKVVRATTRFVVDVRERKDMTEDEKTRVRAERRALDDLLKMVTTAKNVAMRASHRRDSDWLDAALLASGGEAPRKPAWSGRLYSYPLIRRSVPLLSSRVAATIQRQIDQKWAQVRYDVLIRQTESCPHFRVGQPAPIPNQAIKLLPSKSKSDDASKDDSVDLVFSPYSGGETPLRLRLTPRDEKQREQLSSLLSGAWRVGQASIERDRTRLTRFYVRIAYTRLVPRKKEGVSAAINRGMRCFVAAAIEGGESWLYDGEDIEAYLKQIQRRRREYQYASKASERWGHGRTRTIRPIEHLIDKASNWRQTRNQTLARRLARWLVERNVSTVYLEDFTGIRQGEPEKLAGGKLVWDRIQEWPYYELGMRLSSCLEEEGVTVLVVPPQYISQRCPRCGEVRVEHVDRRFWQLKCTTPRCGFRRHLDVATALNVLARGEAMKAGSVKGFGELREAKVSKKQTAREARRKRAEDKENGETGGSD